MTDVTGRIGQRWRELGGPASPLGNPTGPEVQTKTGAWQPFEHGVMVGNPKTDWHPNYGAIRERWGDYKYEGGPLGYPLSPEQPIKDGGRVQRFEQGLIYWHPLAGAHAVYGRIGAKYAALKWENGPLGYPTSDEFDVPGGRCQRFQGGTVYWSLKADAHPVWGSVLTEYARKGYEKGLGLPVGDEGSFPDAWIQDFTKGRISIPKAPPVAATRSYAPPRQHGYTTFRGFPCCTCLAAWLPMYERALLEAGEIKQSLDIYQLRGGAPASGGTHTQGGAFDIGQTSWRAQIIARRMGAAYWKRGYNWDGRGGMEHGHGVLKGCATNDPAFYQIEALNEGYNGLGAGGYSRRDDGPRGDGIAWPIINWDEGIRRYWR